MPACFFLFVAIWMEKGIGLIVPGLIPSPLGEVVDYLPTWVELSVTLGYHVPWHYCGYLADQGGADH